MCSRRHHQSRHINVSTDQRINGSTHQGLYQRHRQYARLSTSLQLQRFKKQGDNNNYYPKKLDASCPQSIVNLPSVAESPSYQQLHERPKPPILLRTLALFSSQPNSTRCSCMGDLATKTHLTVTPAFPSRATSYQLPAELKACLSHEKHLGTQGDNTATLPQALRLPPGLARRALDEYDTGYLPIRRIWTRRGTFKRGTTLNTNINPAPRVLDLILRSAPLQACGRRRSCHAHTSTPSRTTSRFHASRPCCRTVLSMLTPVEVPRRVPVPVRTPSRAVPVEFLPCVVLSIPSC